MLYIIREIKLLIIFLLQVIFRKFLNFGVIHFPINNDNNGNPKLLEFKNHKYKYFIRPYKKHLSLFSILNTHISKDINLMLCYEIFKLQKITKKISFKTKEDLMLPIGTNSEANFCKNIYLDPNKNYYLHLKKNENVDIESKNKILSGNFIKKNNFDSKKIKLNLIIFIDALTNKLTENKELFEKIMPNTKKFFSDGIYFSQHHSNSEWSLPSAANFFTGLNLEKHKIFHNSKHQKLNENIKTMGEIFSENNFVTFKINGSHRISPSYGFAKGFDRSLYQLNMKSHDTIAHFKNFDEVFKNTNKFVWLTFFDVHGTGAPDYYENELIGNNLFLDKKIKKKSVHLDKDNAAVNTYFEKCKFLDYQLKILYDHIEKEYQNNEILISLVTDHGVSFFDDDKKLLGDQRVRIPWFIKGGNLNNLNNTGNEITENIDVMKSILELNKINSDNYQLDGNLPKILGGKEKDYSISQSLYPEATYKCRIDFFSHPFLYCI